MKSSFGNSPVFRAAPFAAFVVFALGCSSTTSTGGGGVADSGSSDAAADTGAAVDSGTPLNGCTTFVDHTDAADARTLTWGLSIASSADRCMKIKVGQSVTWNGNFSTHPLHDDGGDVPNPINGAGTSPAGPIAFPIAGSFGYICGVHASMNGTILVVP
jgi:plastocyanin